MTYLPIPDNTVRLANLQSGDVHIVDRVSATDLEQAKADPKVQIESAVSLGYQGITINVGNGDKANNPLGQDARIRRALSLAIDRNALNQVVFNGAFAAGNQSFPPNSPWFSKDHPVPERDVEAAKALLAEAGYPDGLTIQIQAPNSTEPQQVMQVVQAMAAEAGITIEIVSKEFATMLQDQTAGDYTASQVGWSGRVDPDGNIHQFLTTGGGINDSGYSNPQVDEYLNAARVTNDTAERRELYNKARDILIEDAPLVYLYHPTWIWGLAEGIEGFTPYADGMIRLEGVTLEQ